MIRIPPQNMTVPAAEWFTSNQELHRYPTHSIAAVEGCAEDAPKRWAEWSLAQNYRNLCDRYTDDDCDDRQTTHAAVHCVPFAGRLATDENTNRGDFSLSEIVQVYLLSSRLLMNHSAVAVAAKLGRYGRALRWNLDH